MKIQLKRSNVLESGSAKEPTAEQMEYGELAVNYNTSDPSVFIKDSADNIVKIADAIPPGDGTITIKQPGSPDQSFTVNQIGNTEINLKNDNTQVTPGNGALSIQSFGSGDTSSGTFTANQAGLGTVTLPQISYTDLKNVPPAAAAPGNGTITITQPGTTDQTFTVNQSGNTTIALKNDNTNTTYTANNGVQLSGTNFTADSSVVRTSGTQSIGGAKTFTSNVTVNGAITASGDVTAFSDISLKENIEVIPDALNKLSQLRGVTYNRIDIQGKRQAGVIAQEVETVLPEVVNTNENGIKSVAYGNIVGLLIESIKELKAEVETLKKEQN